MSSQVQETNDYSIASKYSMVHKGYFKDDYMQYLSPKLKRRSPLINIGYYVRAVVVNEGIKLFLNIMQHTESQIVCLGAGFDTTFFRLIHAYDNIRYFEIDLKEVVEKKIAFIKNSENVYSKLINPQEKLYGLTSKNYSIIAQDLSNIIELEWNLISIGFDLDKPTMFFSECAITYMDEHLSTNILNWASKLVNVLFMVYEQINPDDGFGQIMMKHFISIDTPLKSVEIYRTKEDQINRYYANGFTQSCGMGAFEIYKKALSSKDHEHILNLEPFDEWEEWHLTSSHYTLSVGAKGIFETPVVDFFSAFSSKLGNEIPVHDSPLVWEFLKEVKLNLYAHSAVPVWNHEAVLVIGGFGLSGDNKHKRLAHLQLLNLKTMEIRKLNPPDVENIRWDCMYHSTTVLWTSQNETKFLLYGGRTSPVNNVNSPGFVIVLKRNRVVDASITVRKILKCENSPEGRRRHCSVPVDGGVFMFGGISAGNQSRLKVLGDAWLFNHDDEWIKLPSKPPSRFSHSAISHINMVFIVGGLDEHFQPLNDVWSFNISGNVWTRYDVNIFPRYSHTSHYFHNSIVLIGGVNDLSELQPGIGIVNLENCSVAEYKLPKSDKKSPIMLHNHSSILSSELNSVCIIGGGGNCFSFGTSFNKSFEHSMPKVAKYWYVCAEKASMADSL